MSSNGAERPAWRRASFCVNTECVEVGQRDDLIIVRDSSQPEGSRLSYRIGQWRSFVRECKVGAFDDLCP